MSGKVFLVGAGPGDPGLITVKGLEAIQKADVIIYDRLVNPRLLKYRKPEAECIYVGKYPDHHTRNQEEINDLMMEKAKQGKMVIRLKGGDPFIFGRGGEETERCVEEGIPFEVVPGITSAIAVPAYAGIPVTHRDFNSAIAIVTGHERPQKTKSSIQWDKIATATETVVFLMAISKLSFVVEQMVKHGRDPHTPIALIRWGTCVEQETLVGTLSDIVRKAEEAKFSSPAIIIIGEVVRLREKLSWFEKKPLFGKRVLVTRARSQSSVLVKKIEELGGEAVEFPVIQFTRPERQDLLDEALRELGRFDWVIFTSANGVEHFFRRLMELRIDIRSLQKARIAAIGPKTAEALTEKGLIVEVFPKEYRAEALVETLRPLVREGQEILLPRADIARKLLAVELENMGCRVTEVDAYDTKISTENASEVAQLLSQGSIHVITFTSSSTVRNFFEALRTVEEDVHSLIGDAKVVTIGPITAQTAKELGMRVDAMADEYTIDGLVNAIQKLPTE